MADICLQPQVMLARVLVSSRPVVRSATHSVLASLTRSALISMGAYYVAVLEW